MTANPGLVARLRQHAAENMGTTEYWIDESCRLLLSAADAIEARDDDLKDVWMQRDSLQETIREYQALIQARDKDAELNWRHIATARDVLENTILALKNDVSTANAEIEQLNEECKERRDEWARTRTAAERMAKALDAVPSDPRLMWNYDAWKEARASAAAFREMTGPNTKTT